MFDDVCSLSTRSGFPKSEIQLDKCSGWKNITSSSGHNHVEITNLIDRTQKVQTFLTALIFI